MHRAKHPDSAGVMITLQIRLRDGFLDDEVLVRVNGKEVYRKSNVQTDLTISYADAVAVEVDTSPATVEVEVLGGASLKKSVQVHQTPFVDVWILEGRMEIRESNEELPML